MARWAVMVGIARQLDMESTCQACISGMTDWQGQPAVSLAGQSYTITGSGTHTLKWRYTKNGSGTGGSDCAWVDYVQSPSPTDWLTITYGYDSAGRRIEKAYDGQTVCKYLYDGSHIIADYDGNGSLLHKYIYGPGVDQPICMIDVEHSSATYYYHFDGLGSVIALTNSSGSVVNLYEYSVFGEVSASDPNHPNRFLFTGREFDADTGLYYYRARYYNPYIGRFLQTDPAGQGMNAYAYCGNDPIGLIDPSGLAEEPVVGGGPRPGPWALQTVGISARRLISWYFVGKGIGLWYKGGHAGDLLEEAAHPLVQAWLRYNDSAALNGMRYSIDSGYKSGTMYQPLGDLQFESSAWGGYADIWREIFGGSSDRAIKNLLNFGALYMDGSYSGEWNEDHTKLTVTIKAYYSYVDWADLHPDRYTEDVLGKLFEGVWNYHGPFPTPLMMPNVPWILYTRYGGTQPQPYQILIQTDVITTIVEFKTKTNAWTVVSHFP